MKALIGLRAWLGSVVYWLFLVVSILIYATLMVLAWVLPLRVRQVLARQWSWLNIQALRRLCGLYYEVEDQRGDAGRRGGYLVFSKHQSAWETLMLNVEFPGLTWVLKRELLWIPMFGWALAATHPIALNRAAGRRAVEQLIRLGKARLEAGEPVVIFPEGTRVPPGVRGRYRIGGALLAAETGAPIIPVAHHAGEFWPRRGFLKRPGLIKVVIGAPIASAGRPAAEIMAECEDWIESQMARISSLSGNDTASQ